MEYSFFHSFILTVLSGPDSLSSCVQVFVFCLYFLSYFDSPFLVPHFLSSCLCVQCVSPVSHCHPVLMCNRNIPHPVCSTLPYYLLNAITSHRMEPTASRQKMDLESTSLKPVGESTLSLDVTEFRQCLRRRSKGPRRTMKRFTC